MITNVFIFAALILITGCSSAPKPPQVSVSGDVDPVNFHNPSSQHTVITSQQMTRHWRRQFVYTIDYSNPSPEFFYAIAHADKIIANIRPPFIDFAFNKLQADLRRYGVTTPVALFIVQESDQQAQVILDCIKLNNESEL